MRIPTIEEIELAIMNYKEFNYRQNMMVFRVSDFSNIVNHECDCLIMSKSGYLTEIEIKRSYSDFMADFRKKHTHNDPIIKSFYYMIHESFYDKAYHKLIELKHIPTGIYTYNDDCNITLVKTGHEMLNSIEYKGLIWDAHHEGIAIHGNSSARPLFLEERLQLARIGAMRYKNMTEKIIKATNE
ncbi:MAG: hypothetical protein ACRCX5_14370 [Bacteroidales bacterium]